MEETIPFYAQLSTVLFQEFDLFGSGEAYFASTRGDPFNSVTFTPRE
jgi:hypothetical protein